MAPTFPEPGRAPDPVSRIWVDADSCPVRVEVYRAARRRGVGVVLVANRAFRAPGWVDFQLPARPGSPGAADDHIAARVAPEEVVVTDDLELALRCLDAGARVVGSRGRIFRREGVERARRLRDRRAARRARGEITAGPPPVTRVTRRRFREALATLLAAPPPRPDHPSGRSSTTTRFRPASLAR